MGEVVEITEQDSEATALECAEWALEELGDVLVNELFGELNAMNEQLAQEREEQAAKAETLRESQEQLKPRVEAQQRIIDADIDRAIAEGRDADADAKRLEIAGLEQNLGNILAQAEACERRVQEIEAEQKQNYRKVFESAYPEIRASIVSVEIALVTLLNRIWESFLRFEQESGQKIIRTPHKMHLTPHDRGPELKYFLSLYRWFGFGGRR